MAADDRAARSGGDRGLRLPRGTGRRTVNGQPAGVAATYLLEEHAALASDNPLADRGLIVPASLYSKHFQPHRRRRDGGPIGTVMLRRTPQPRLRLRRRSSRRSEGMAADPLRPRPIQARSFVKRSTRRVTFRMSDNCRRSAGVLASRTRRFSASSTSRRRARAERSSRRKRSTANTTSRSARQPRRSIPNNTARWFPKIRRRTTRSPRIPTSHCSNANYRAVTGPVENVAGRPATTVSLVNRYSGERMMRLVDRQRNENRAGQGSLSPRRLARMAVAFDEIRFTGRDSERRVFGNDSAGFPGSRRAPLCRHVRRPPAHP